jgi:hypothetical protein
MEILFDIHKLAKLVESNSCSFLKKYLPNKPWEKKFSNKIAMFLLLHIVQASKQDIKGFQ